MSVGGLSVLITGAASGIGAVTARLFSEHGARVAVTDIDDGKGQLLANELAGAIFLSLDVTDEANWEQVLASTVDAFGSLDVLVNNAGYFTPNVPMEDMSLALWRKHFSVNADSVFLGCKHALRCMRAHGGAVVNLASSLAVKPNADASAYCASKAAVLMTTRTAALSGAPHGIRVNAVLPGPIETPMLMKNAATDESALDVVARFAARSALGRLATKEEVAQAVLFLADPANGATTGASVSVDAGLTIA